MSSGYAKKPTSVPEATSTTTSPLPCSDFSKLSTCPIFRAGPRDISAKTCLCKRSRLNVLLRSSNFEPLLFAKDHNLLASNTSNVGHALQCSSERRQRDYGKSSKILYPVLAMNERGFWIPGAGVTAIFNSAVQEVLDHCKITVADSMRAKSSRVPLSDVSSRTAMNVASG